MAKSSLSDCMSIINQHIASQCFVSDHHLKAEAMLEVLLNGDFYNQPKKIVYEYLCALRDVLVDAKDCHEHFLDHLIARASLITDPCKPPEGETIH